MCPYQFYKKEETYYPRLYCKLRENTSNPYCTYSKKCGKEKKFITLDNTDKCIIMIENKKNDIPKGSYYVKTFKQRANGTYTLYVDIDDTIVKIDTSFTDFDGFYIYLDIVDGKYIPSLNPIPKKKKKETNKSNGKRKTD